MEDYYIKISSPSSLYLSEDEYRIHRLETDCQMAKQHRYKTDNFFLYRIIGLFAFLLLLLNPPVFIILYLGIFFTAVASIFLVPAGAIILELFIGSDD